MARILSFAMMLFLLVPGIAPLMGAAIAGVGGWRMIFASYLVFGVIMLMWFGTRITETLPRPQRRPIRMDLMTHAVSEMLRHPTVRLSIIVQTLMLTMLFCILTMVQQIFEVTFDMSESFPAWFGVIALVSGVSSLLNAMLVGRLGMRRLITWALVAQLIASGSVILFLMSGAPGLFWVYVVWQFGVMFQGGLTVANLNAIAMEPMGHIAGMAASVIGAISTVVAAALASPLSMLFDGTPLPLVSIVFVLCVAALFCMMQMRRLELEPEAA